MRKQPISFYRWHLLVLTIMAIIYYFSSQSGEVSREVSTGTLEQIIAHLGGILPAAFLDWLTLWIRKAAHFLIYLLLGLSAAMMMKSRNGRKTNRYRNYAEGWLIAALYACTDEIHQLFVPERAGMIKDVLLDSAGALSGVLIAAAACTIAAHCRSILEQNRH